MMRTKITTILPALALLVLARTQSSHRTRLKRQWFQKRSWKPWVNVWVFFQPPTDRISAPQGASAKPRPQFTGQNCSQVHNHSVVEANDYTFGPYAPNQNQTFGPRIQNPNQTFGPQSQNQNLGHNPNRTLGPKALSQNVSQNRNQTFGPQGQSQNYDFAVLTYNIQTW